MLSNAVAMASKYGEVILMRYFDILMQLLSTCLQCHFTNKGALFCFCSVWCYPRIPVNINKWIICNYSIAWLPLSHCALMFNVCKCSRTPLIRINWDGEPFRYAENPVIGFFFYNRLHWQFAVSSVTIYSMYLRLNLSTTSG